MDAGNSQKSGATPQPTQAARPDASPALTAFFQNLRVSDGAQGQAAPSSAETAAAQRDVFERLAIEAALRGGLVSQATSLLRERDLFRGVKDGYSERRWAAIETVASKSRLGDHSDIAALNVA